MIRLLINKAEFGRNIHEKTQVCPTTAENYAVGIFNYAKHPIPNAHVETFALGSSGNGPKHQGFKMLKIENISDFPHRSMSMLSYHLTMRQG